MDYAASYCYAMKHATRILSNLVNTFEKYEHWLLKEMKEPCNKVAHFYQYFILNHLKEIVGNINLFLLKSRASLTDNILSKICEFFCLLNKMHIALYCRLLSGKCQLNLTISIITTIYSKLHFFKGLYL